MSTLVTPPLVGAPVMAPAAPAMAVPPTPSPYPRPLRWTAAEFNRVNAAGIWEGRRALLIDGVIWEQGPMNPPHAIGIMRITRALSPCTPAGHHVRIQLPLLVGTVASVFPDAAVVPGGEDDYNKAHPTGAVLVVEVSDTTLFFDRTAKAEVYATAGVPVYWIVDLESRVLHVFTDPQALPDGVTAYRARTELRDGESVAGPDGRAVAVAALFPPAE